MEVIMNSFVLKIIACFSMLMDHLGYVVIGSTSFFNCIGRLAFPIFAFQLTEGYSHTKNLKKYFFRLLIFACLSQIPFMLFSSIFTEEITINIIFVLVLGLLFMTIYDKFNKILGITFGIVLAILAQLLHFDYGWYGLAIIMIFHIFKKHKILMSTCFIIATFTKYIVSIVDLGVLTILNVFTTINLYSLLCLSTCLALIFISLYNNKKGPDSKYFLYVFYPVHLLILYLLNFII